MPFSQEQTDWIERIAGRGPDLARDAAIAEERRRQLAEMHHRVDAIRGELAAAYDAIRVRRDETVLKRVVSEVRAHLPGSDGRRGDRLLDRGKKGGADSEIDTYADLKGGFSIDDEAALMRLMNLHRELVSVQHDMEEATVDGHEVFTAKDIERELWTPLVRERVIPANAVADRYSQEAQVWEGACGVYLDMLEAHTREVGEHQTIAHGIELLRKGITIATPAILQGLKIPEFEGFENGRTFVRDVRLAQLRLDDSGGSDYEGRAEDEALSAEFGEKLDQREEYGFNAALAQFGLGFADHALDVTGKAITAPKERRAKLVTEALLATVEDAILSGMAIDTAYEAKQPVTEAYDSDYKSQTGMVQAVIGCTFNAIGVVPKLMEVARAAHAGKDWRKEFEKAFNEIMDDVADTVEKSLSTLDTSSGGTTDPETGAAGYTAGTVAEYQTLGASVGAVIRAVGNRNATTVGKQLLALSEDIAEGRPIDKKALAEIAGSLGGNAIGMTMALAQPAFSDAVLADKSADDPSAVGIFEETTYVDKETGAERKPSEIVANTEGNPATMNAIMGAALKLGEALRDVTEIDAEAWKTRQEAALRERQRAEQMRDLQGFRERMANDAAARERLLAEISAETDLEMAKIHTLLADAHVFPEDLEDAERRARAHAAIDKLIVEAKRLNQTWAFFTALCGGGPTMLLSALPVVGLVAAVQRLLVDFAVLTKKTYQLQVWRKNMALTVGNSSVYGDAIRNRLDNARVQEARYVGKVLFDAVGLASEAAKLGDETGASTGLAIGAAAGRAGMEAALTLHDEIKIARGWQLYKAARDDPGNRKLARKAVNWNSTLAKCVLAYGIVKDDDPIAKQVARNCGLTPEILADQNDVCSKVVTYFQTIYSDDPEVMKRVPVRMDWHPGPLDFSFDCWLRFKAAAAGRARPALARPSTQTPDIDRALERLSALLSRAMLYEPVAEERLDRIRAHPHGDERRAEADAAIAFFDEILQALGAAVDGFGAYAPVNAEPPDPLPAGVASWDAGARHAGMAEIAQSMAALAIALRQNVGYDRDTALRLRV